ncbi:MAG: VOC family protein [Actinobacteria bacterium]|uniref:Unannotated protein n=1 Tax=freshwater metagenome TaxID=449393 RepID=A0A6J6S9V1_9ZZZZ|nr:VOC family protein [Actinomycetota bacterium]
MSLTTVPGAPIWIELYTSDPAGAQRFYADLFGWSAETAGPEYGGYVTFHRAGEPVAGCMLNDGTTGGVNSWSVYLESNDVEATVGMAEANGGQIEIEPMQVGTLGHMAFVIDPAGARIGIWQPDSMTGFAVRGAVGAPGWFEVLSTDFAAAVPFYENVFGWSTHPMSDTDEFRYTTLGKDDLALAGVMDASRFASNSAWSVYVEVADTDATVAAAVAGGGSVLAAAEDTPVGRLAELADPSGAVFKVMGPTGA